MELIENFLESYGLGAFTEVTVAVIIVLASVVAAKFVYYLFESWFNKLAARTRSEVDDRILNAAKKPIYYIIILIGIQIAFSYLLLNYASYNDYVSLAITIFLILIAAYVLANIITIIVEDFGKKISAKTESTLADEALPFGIKLINAAIYLFTILIILDKLNINIIPLIAGLGILGFALGFGAKDIVANILAGFFILLDRPFIRGERIEVRGNSGDVFDIGLRTTRIRTSTDEIVIIPNSDIVSSAVKNYSLPEKRVKLVTNYRVSYGSDVEEVKKVIFEVACESKTVISDPLPEVYFIEFGESSLNFKLVCWIPTFMSESARDELNTKIYNRFNREGISIPFPTKKV